MIKAVIFDMDGVLSNSEPLICEASIEMFKEKGFIVKEEDFLPFVGAGDNRYIGGVAEKYGINLDIEAAKKRTYEIYLDLVKLKLNAFPGAKELVYACKKEGFLIALASSSDLIKIKANLYKIELPPQMWDIVISAEDEERRKPAPDIFLTAAQKLGLQPEECIVIEDAVNGVQAAKAANMRCIAVAQSFPAEKLQEADIVKEKISQISITDLKS